MVFLVSEKCHRNHGNGQFRDSDGVYSSYKERRCPAFDWVDVMAAYFLSRQSMMFCKRDRGQKGRRGMGWGSGASIDVDVLAQCLVRVRALACGLFSSIVSKPEESSEE